MQRLNINNNHRLEFVSIVFSCLVPKLDPTHWSIPVLPHYGQYYIIWVYAPYTHESTLLLTSGFVTYSRISSLRKFTLLRLGNRAMITSSTDGFTALNSAIRTTRFSLPVIISVHFTLIMRCIPLILMYHSALFSYRGKAKSAGSIHWNICLDFMSIPFQKNELLLIKFMTKLQFSCFSL